MVSSRVTVSTDGGSNPVWANSGTELFFLDAARRMNIAQIDTTSGRVLDRRVLFTLRPEFIGFSSGDSGDDLYDIAPDDERFLMARLVDDGEIESSRKLVVVLNFFDELRRRVLD